MKYELKDDFHKLISKAGTILIPFVVLTSFPLLLVGYHALASKQVKRLQSQIARLFH